MLGSFMSGLHLVDFTAQLIVFLTITVGAFIVLAITFFAGAVFGADHDAPHEHDIGGHDVHDHDSGYGSEVSIFSPKVLLVFFAAFGAGGSIASLYGCGAVSASMWGLLTGVLFGAIAYLGLSLLYKAQSNSVVKTTSAVGQIGHVSTSIRGQNGVGEVEVNISGQAKTYTAQAKLGTTILRGTSVKVVEVQGATLLVEVAS
jgi:membrane protein implicated in regulation of membrane protease activity